MADLPTLRLAGQMKPWARVALLRLPFVLAAVSRVSPRLAARLVDATARGLARWGFTVQVVP